ncbi:MAG: hypothetical protein LAT63_13585 [Marinobacter sp.]|nr:hypothetical protein [Marinobacter sp.]
MQTVFIRHQGSSTPNILKQLWDRRLIALHYHDDYSTNPADYYPAGCKALERLWAYCNKGALVGADFRSLNNASMLVGCLEPGTKIFSERFQDPETGEAFIYKVAPLSHVVEVRYADYPLLLAIQPRQGTLTGWPSAEHVLVAAHERRSLSRKAGSLHPSQHEVLCYEWLRNKGQLERLVLPIGRGLQDIDIFGINTQGQRVFGQVTYSKNAAQLYDKHARLLNHARDTDTVYFFLPENAPLDADAGVELVTLEKVLADLENSQDVSVKAMLSEMFAEYR